MTTFDHERYDPPTLPKLTRRRRFARLIRIAWARLRGEATFIEADKAIVVAQPGLYWIGATYTPSDPKATVLLELIDGRGTVRDREVAFFGEKTRLEAYVDGDAAAGAQLRALRFTE